MQLSARNQIEGKITSVKQGSVSGIVTLDIGGGQSLVASISMDSIESLGLKTGVQAIAVVKASSVLIGTAGGRNLKLSARNQLKGKVSKVEDGAVNGVVQLDLSNGKHVVSTITMDSIKRLGLKPGVEAVAFIKATSVMVGILA